MGQHTDDCPTIDPASVDLGCQTAVRPVNDDIISIRKPRPGREHRSGVAHRHPRTGAAAEPRDRGCKVDGPEDQHPRTGRIAGREYAHSPTAPLTIGTVREQLRLT